jgi:hypothetical protein
MINKMSHHCQASVKNGEKCKYKASYLYAGEYRCGTHMPRAERGNPAHQIKGQEPARSIQVPVISDKHEVSSSLTCTHVFEFRYKGIIFRTIQAAYEAMKFYYKHGNMETNVKLLEHVRKISKETDYFIVKQLGNETKLPIRHDWNGNERFNLRDRFMFDILSTKIAMCRSASIELAESDDKILFDNSCGGSYWSGDGNRYGEFLMMIRSEAKRMKS